MRYASLAAFLLLVSLCGQSLAIAQEGGTPFSPYTISISVKGAGEPRMFECLFVAKEASSGKEVFAPKIVVPQGEPARAASKGEDGAAFSLDLLVDKDGKEASFTFTVSRNSDEVQREEGKVEVHR